MQQKPEFIRRESIQNIPFMTREQKENIKTRIYKNDDISGAKARQMSRAAKRATERANSQLKRANSMVRHYQEDIESIDNRFRRRLATLRNSEPRAPQLRTLQRAADRSRHGDLKAIVTRPYDQGGWQGYVSRLPPGAVKHTMPFNIVSIKPIREPYSVSIHEPMIFQKTEVFSSAQLERTKIR